MKAIVYTKYGPPETLQLKEIAKPVPKENQVLVKIYASSVNALDYRRFESLSRIGQFMEHRLIKSIGKALGADIAGRVDSVGSAVTQFKPGDEVFGVAAGSVGAFAEYACAAENTIALKPSNVSFETAAAVPVAALTALQALRDKGHIQPGQKVLINGASGGVGSFAMQIAKSFGAEVTAVCSTRNVDMVRKLGADHVIDYTRENFTKSGQRYDLIAAINGNYPIGAYRRALAPGGRYVAVGGAIPQVLQGIIIAPILSRFGSKKMGFMGIAQINKKDLLTMSELLETGKVAPIIDRCYPLNETVAAVHYMLEEHARGKVVITVGA